MIKQLGHEVDHWPSSAEVKNDWNNSFSPSVGNHDVERDNFSFTSYKMVIFCHICSNTS